MGQLQLLELTLVIFLLIILIKSSDSLLGIVSFLNFAAKDAWKSGVVEQKVTWKSGVVEQKVAMKSGFIYLKRLILRCLRER